MPLVPPIFAFGLILQAFPPNLAVPPGRPSPGPPPCLLTQNPDRLWDSFLKAIKHKWTLGSQLGPFPLLWAFWGSDYPRCFCLARGFLVSRSTGSVPGSIVERFRWSCHADSKEGEYWLGSLAWTPLLRVSPCIAFLRDIFLRCEMQNSLSGDQRIGEDTLSHDPLSDSFLHCVHHFPR